MAKTRICGKRCHLAKHATCRCWCGGTFHGAEGLEARSAFTAAFRLEKLPTTQALFEELTNQRLFDQFEGQPPRAEWRERVAARVAAQQATAKHRRPHHA